MPCRAVPCVWVGARARVHTRVEVHDALKECGFAVASCMHGLEADLKSATGQAVGPQCAGGMLTQKLRHGIRHSFDLLDLVASDTAKHDDLAIYRADEMVRGDRAQARLQGPVSMLDV